MEMVNVAVSGGAASSSDSFANKAAASSSKYEGCASATFDCFQLLDPAATPPAPTPPALLEDLREADDPWDASGAGGFC